ncbi:MAG: hypothetical protein ACRCWD_08200 [Culicoidibacterales bacterium]
MNEQKINLIFTNSFIFFVILFSNFALFLLMKFFGFKYENIVTVCFFIFTFYSLSAVIAILVENGIARYTKVWQRRVCRILLIPTLNFLIMIGLLIGLPSLSVPPVTIISISFISFLAESFFVYWLDIDTF